MRRERDGPKGSGPGWKCLVRGGGVSKPSSPTRAAARPGEPSPCKGAHQKASAARSGRKDAKA